MLTFDRILLTMLAFGIWALVLTPQKLSALHDGHSCLIDGIALGDVDKGGGVSVNHWNGVTVDCAHD